MVGMNGGECQGENVLYEMECLKCKENKKITSYIGESSRTGHARGSNHIQDLLKKREGKPLWTHSTEEHGGVLQPGGPGEGDGPGRVAPL